ncbi:NAD-dependent epimerase/dehydratase family protein [Kribbella sindirgiensis]|uniref:NAD(P)-dependent oxidoreductase n=1 Tax=Kribbella sindirgiensis TaxID=1124744 RepID=A0A4R0IUB8_9ACTN|nr:NAD(P)-dependent oxidoreductase [Kribbella sindirgiensis]TCC35038.1 NAD(P)-dependent oxidoreductase [Kribbella sindirgiensis]
MNRVLVTGAAGRIGCAVLEALGRDRVTALVLPGTPVQADRVVEGSVCDVATVRAAMGEVDGVIHLAARPAPHRGTPYEVFGENTLGTFTVLEEAGRAGVRNAVVASSLAANGLPFATAPLSPAYVPLDDRVPSQAEDPYALSKLTDEQTAAMMSRRHGMAVVALRFPFVGGFTERLREHADKVAADPSLGAASLWSYLETRDAARAAVLALRVPGGSHTFHVAAPRTLAPYPTLDLLRRFHPTTEIRAALPGRTTPLDLAPAQHLLGFTAEHEL